ncbi:MAG: imidazole glycerol phosphate synthase cyclase subunit [Planctomycetota bacterium]|nr:imidazole glycerol phosphate synthase cyclase subunit [Planctomycetota bacterium]MCX8040457.1 imidazole glycerol phosphate synthase cyclase subunit [Planctomycetota bacterium]MDW8373205.1 imidazole glycerol phosphate synthase cyclase subunit [Planctomycetota bacterium]
MPLRLIARLDIKAPNLVKGVRLEGLRVIGDPAEHAARYTAEGIDEIHYQDIVASLYQRNSIVDLVRATAERVFVPLTVGGGIRTIEDIRTLLRAGADKVCINTAAVRRPDFIREAATTFGSQCIVVAIEAIRQKSGRWEAFTDNGREHTGLDAYDWARRAVELGAGEILLTSVDREGTARGMDLEFIRSVGQGLPVPVVAHGGVGCPQHAVEAADLGVDGIAVAHVLHYRRHTIAELKAALAAAGHTVRMEAA